MVLFFLGWRGLVIEGGEGAGELVGVGSGGLGRGRDVLPVGKNAPLKDARGEAGFGFGVQPDGAGGEGGEAEAVVLVGGCAVNVLRC